MKTPFESLLERYPGTHVVSVRQPLDEATFQAQKIKHEQRQAEGGAIGVVWAGANAVVLARRTRKDLHPGWSLLGGTVENGQEFDDAFEREVLEEAGIRIHIKRLALAEQKVFVSPGGQELPMNLAVFEATAQPGESIVATLEAEAEGLEVKEFPLDELPAEMALKDRDKLESMMAARSE